MAIPSLKLIQSLRTAAYRIEASQHYQWGHMGSCNCGFLAQVITKRTKEEIHQSAMLRHGDWSEQLNDYCPTSGFPMDDIISKLVAFGFDLDDLKHLEYLSDQEVIRSFPREENNPHFNTKEDVVRYIRAWACLLEEQLLQRITIPDFADSRIVQ